MRRLGWGRQKPPIGARIATGHPLASGLAGYFLLNEGAGTPISAAPYRLPVTAFSGAWTDLPGVGRATTFTAASSQYVEHDPINVVDLSIGVIFSWPSYANTNESLIQADGNESFRINPNSDGGTFAIQMSDGSLGTNQIADFSRALAPAGQTHRLVVTFHRDGTSGLRAYLNGIEIVLSYLLNGAMDGAFNATFIRWMRNHADLYSTGSLGLVAYWTRVLSAAEAMAWTLDPYAMFAAPVRYAARGSLAALEGGHWWPRWWARTSADAAAAAGLTRRVLTWDTMIRRPRVGGGRIVN